MLLTLVPPRDSWVRRYWVAIVFLFAALGTTKIIDVQGRTIQTQRSLIVMLSRDSLELQQMKVREFEKNRGNGAKQGKPQPTVPEAPENDRQAGRRRSQPRDFATQTPLRALSFI